MEQSLADLFAEEEARMRAEDIAEQIAFNALPQIQRDAIKNERETRTAAERHPSRCVYTDEDEEEDEEE